VCSAFEQPCWRRHHCHPALICCSTGACGAECTGQDRHSKHLKWHEIATVAHSPAFRGTRLWCFLQRGAGTRASVRSQPCPCTAGVNPRSCRRAAPAQATFLAFLAAHRPRTRLLLAESRRESSHLAGFVWFELVEVRVTMPKFCRCL
jgi:hypothetical protein